MALDLMKEFGSFLSGAGLSAAGFIFKDWWWPKWKSKADQKQTRWYPLLEAAQDLKQRLEELTNKYKQCPPNDPWGKDQKLPSEARDFCELYTLHDDPDPIKNLDDSSLKPGLLRKNNDDQERVRTRMGHPLNFAANSLYRTAKYLGYAVRVRKELATNKLVLPERTRRVMKEKLEKVRDELHGTSKQHPGAGIILEQQDLIGESVWSSNDYIISDWDFRERLLNEHGWQQYTGLFRFYVNFHMKIYNEVADTIKALAALCEAIESLCL